MPFPVILFFPPDLQLRPKKADRCNVNFPIFYFLGKMQHNGFPFFRKRKKPILFDVENLELPTKIYNIDLKPFLKKSSKIRKEKEEKNAK